MNNVPVNTSSNPNMNSPLPPVRMRPHCIMTPRDTMASQAAAHRNLQQDISVLAGLVQDMWPLDTCTIHLARKTLSLHAVGSHPLWEVYITNHYGYEMPYGVLETPLKKSARTGKDALILMIQQLTTDIRHARQYMEAHRILQQQRQLVTLNNAAQPNTAQASATPNFASNTVPTPTPHSASNTVATPTPNSAPTPARNPAHAPSFWVTPRTVSMQNPVLPRTYAQTTGAVPNISSPRIHHGIPDSWYRSTLPPKTAQSDTTKSSASSVDQSKDAISKDDASKDAKSKNNKE